MDFGNDLVFIIYNFVLFTISAFNLNSKFDIIITVTKKKEKNNIEKNFL